MTGFINVLKPEGVGSTKVVGRVKYLLKTPCGHLGTLDPLACGVLPVAVGNAARLFDYFLSKQKRYFARFVFGATASTLDREGEIVRGGRVPSAEEVRAALPAFVGDIMQVPPQYSAVSVNGRRGYDLARRGAEFDLPPKKVHISAFTLTEQTAEDEFCFDIACGGGTYIRSLARDLAAALGTTGYMSFLCRTESGPFTFSTGVPFNVLTAENVRDFLIPTQDVLPFPVLEGADARIFHGVGVPVDAADGQYKLFSGGAFYGIARVRDGIARAEKKLC